MKSKPSLKRNLLAVAILSAMLAVVFYAMQYTRSLDFQATLGLLFNPSGENTWNWCPKELQVASLQGHTLDKNSDIYQLCTVKLEPFEGTAAEPEFKPLAEVKSEKKTVILESNAELEIFRVDGLPFKSKKLSDFIKARLAEF